MEHPTFEKAWSEFWKEPVSGPNPALEAIFKEAFKAGWQAGLDQGWENGLDAAGAGF